jgi:uncharacterized protein with PIN domain
MTPKQTITVNFLEITKVEITCLKCGAALVFPVPKEKGQDYPPQSYTCPGCHTVFWNDANDERYTQVYNLISALAHWQTSKSRAFDLSFSLISN